MLGNLPGVASLTAKLLFRVCVFTIMICLDLGESPAPLCRFTLAVCFTSRGLPSFLTALSVAIERDHDVPSELA